MKTLFSILSIVLLTYSCGNSKELAKEENPIVQKAKIVESFKEYSDGASVNINAPIKTEDDKLILIVSYSGGCAEHSFELLGMNAIEKSLPPKRRIKLYHDNNGDSCREFVTDTIEFDMQPLYLENGNELELILEGFDLPITVGGESED